MSQLLDEQMSLEPVSDNDGSRIKEIKIKQYYYSYLWLLTRDTAQSAAQSTAQSTAQSAVLLSVCRWLYW